MVEPDNPDALAEALIALLKNPTLRQAIARNGQMTVHKRFCCKTMALHTKPSFTILLSEPLSVIELKQLSEDGVQTILATLTGPGRLDRSRSPPGFAARIVV